MGVLFDIVLVVCLTLLCYVHILPKDAFLLIIGPFIGARIMVLKKGGGGGSAAIALFLASVALLYGRHDT